MRSSGGARRTVGEEDPPLVREAPVEIEQRGEVLPRAAADERLALGRAELDRRQARDHALRVEDHVAHHPQPRALLRAQPRLEEARRREDAEGDVVHRGLVLALAVRQLARRLARRRERPLARVPVGPLVVLECGGGGHGHGHVGGLRRVAGGDRQLRDRKWWLVAWRLANGRRASRDGRAAALARESARHVEGVHDHGAGEEVQRAHQHRYPSRLRPSRVLAAVRRLRRRRLVGAAVHHNYFAASAASKVAPRCVPWFVQRTTAVREGALRAPKRIHRHAGRHTRESHCQRGANQRAKRRLAAPNRQPALSLSPCAPPSSSHARRSRLAATCR